MSTGLTYEEAVELLPAYTLGALDVDEMMAMDDYLQRHHALLARVERLDAATAQLAYIAPIAPLSSHVKNSLMGQIRAEAIPARTLSLLNAAERVTQNLPAVPKNTPLLPARQQQEQMYALARPNPVVPPQPAKPTKPTATPTRRFDFGWLAAAAMAVAALFIIWIDFGAQRQLLQLRADVTGRDTEITQLNQQIQSMTLQLQQNQGQLAFFAAPTQIVPLAGQGKAPTAGGVFYQHNNRAILVLHGLPPLPADQTYQLWLIPAQGAPAPAGLLAIATVDPNGQQVSLPESALGYQAVGISIEPLGGSETPTAGNIVLVGERT